VGRGGILVPSAEASALLQARERDGHAQGELTFLRADGTTFPVAVTSAIVLSDGGERHSVVVFRDLSERTEREGWLLASQRVANLGHYVFELAANRWTSSVTLDQIFGIGPDFQRDAGTWLSLVHEEDRPAMAAYLQGLLASGSRFDRIYRVSREGAPRWVHGLGDLERDAAGQPVRLFGTIQDVTARVEAEQAREALSDQLRQAQKLESIGRLAGGVAHDFNNILVVILTCADAVQQCLVEGRPPEAADVEEIQAAAHRARELTAQLLAFARKQVVAPVVLDLNVAVRRAERLLRRLLGEDIALDIRLDPAPAPVTCDAGQLQQVLMNLAVNARDAMPSGGRLVISTTNMEAAGQAPAGWIGLGLDPGPGPHVRLLVEDTGVGVPVELRSTIFEPFVTGKPLGQGTGLGLATVYGIVRQAGGMIRFHSEEGRGTAFELLWPRSAEPQAAAATPEPQPQAVQPSQRILLVEDDDLVRDATTRALRAAGYEVSAAGGGAEALALVAHGLTPPHLLLTDVVMPGMNGRQVADALRAVVPGLRVLFMSGYAGDIIARHGVVEPGLDLLDKPFTSAGLLARVRAALGG
jgi:PAS domain S-box-containing protein